MTAPPLPDAMMGSGVFATSGLLVLVVEGWSKLENAVSNRALSSSPQRR